jgi:hypothetical protein
MKKLLLSALCLTLAFAIANQAEARWGRSCGPRGCGVSKSCVKSCEPQCEARVCYMEPCKGPCPEPEEVTCEKHIEYRKCIMMVPKESTYPVEVCCTTTKRCVVTECPAGACGEGAPAAFPDGTPVTGDGSHVESYTIDTQKGLKKNGLSRR